MASKTETIPDIAAPKEREAYAGLSEFEPPARGWTCHASYTRRRHRRGRVE